MGSRSTAWVNGDRSSALLHLRNRTEQIGNKEANESEGGTGIVGSMFGALVFLAFVAFATHTLIGLYASSVVSTTAWREATRVARAESDVASADNRIHGKLAHVSPSTIWNTGDPGFVSLTINAQRPSLLPRSMIATSSLTSINRTVIVRKELQR